MNLLQNKLKRRTIFFALFTSLFVVNLYPHELMAQQKLHISDKDNVVKEISALFKKGDLEGAKQVIDRNLAKTPKDSDLRMFLGKYYVLRKHYDKARYELNKAVEYNPGNVDAKQLLVTVETETKRYSSAICYVNELLEVNPYWRGLWRKKIELYRLQGNKVEADRLLKRISQIFPDDSEIQTDIVYQAELSANTLRKNGKIDDAIEINKLLLQERPNQLATYLDLINSYIKTGDYPAALATTERGLNHFANNGALIDKKISILDHENRYDEILSLLQQQMKIGGSASYTSKYNYFLVEAARYAKANDPAVLYGKILANDAGNEEAFQYVFNFTVAQQQYDEALDILHRFMTVRGNSKVLSLKELDVYKLKGDKNKINQITKSLFQSYPTDSDIKAAYLNVLTGEIRDHMASQEYKTAFPKLNEVLRHGDPEQQAFALNGLYNAYFQTGQFSDALILLKEKITQDPSNDDLYIKLAGIYERQQQYEQAAEIYEQLFLKVAEDKKSNYLSGYHVLVQKIIKEANEAGQYALAYAWSERWLKHDQENKDALMYAVNLSYQLKEYAKMLNYARHANKVYPNDIQFKLKLLTANMLNGAAVKEKYHAVQQEINLYPFNEQVQLSFVQFSKDYGQQLLKERSNTELIQVMNSALDYQPADKEMKYLKGLAYENLHQFDSAYFYQRYYEPTYLEQEDFKAHLNYLSQRGLKNQVGLYHLRTRFGDMSNIQTISTFEYSRLSSIDTYTARFNYAGRDEGKGVQAQLEWGRSWSPKWSSRVDLAYSKMFFPKLAAQVALSRTLEKEWETEVAIGYRKLYSEETMYNATLGVTKEINSFRLNAKYTQFLLDDIMLFNFGVQARYALNSPKNYIVGMANVGNSPDVDIINYQFVNSYSVLNAMVGAGAGRMISKNLSIGVLGTWYNFETNPSYSLYRNLYNLYLQVHVSF